MKKYTLIFLFIFMFTFIFSCNCFANDFIDLTTNENEASMYNILNSYDILNGFPDGSFMPDKYITRAQMAKIAIVLKGYKNYTTDIKSSFSDMNNHWAEKYVEFSNILHLVEGYNDNTFKPDDFVLYNNAIKVILKVLGYNDENIVDNNTKTYKYNTKNDNYIKKAKELGILDNINSESIYMTRGNIAKVIYNSLNCKLISNVFVSSNNKKTLFDNIGKFKRMKITDDFALKHKEYDLSKYILNTCDIYFDKYDNIVYVGNQLHPTSSEHIRKILSNNCLVTEDRYKNIQINELQNIPIVFNSIKSKPSKKLLENSDAIFLLSRNNIIIGAVVEKVTKSTIVNSKDIYDGKNTFMGCYLPLKKDKPDFDNIVIKGAVNSLYDIKENDIVYFMETLEDNQCKSILKLEVVRNNLNGTFYGINTTNNQTNYSIDNKLYRVSKNNKIIEKPSIGDNVLIILDNNNEIIDVKIIKYAKKPSSFGKILNISDESSELPSVELVDAKGKVNKFILKENCGCVIKSTNKSSIMYTTSLSKNDIVLYDVENEVIKIIEKQKHTIIKSIFDTNNKIFVKNNSTINNNTIILKNNKTININQLGYYIEGKAIIKNNNVLLVDITTNLIKKEETTPIVQEQKQRYTGTIIGAISKIKTDNDVSKVLLFNNNKYFDIKKDIVPENYTDSLVKVCIVNDEITKIIKYKPEISKSTITKLYNLQLQIDYTSFVEYSKDTLIFSCKYDKKGKLIKFASKEISDLKINTTVQFYQTENNYNGVMNIILILE